MRFWSKTKHGEKKLSREKQASRSETGESHGRSEVMMKNSSRAHLGYRIKTFFFFFGKKILKGFQSFTLGLINSQIISSNPSSLCLPEGPSPPHSPDLEAAPSRGVRDSKENKEPSPKMRRRRSVKISSIALEPAQWQNDALHILTSAHDYRSMNDFLMKKVSVFVWVPQRFIMLP